LGFGVLGLVSEAGVAHRAAMVVAEDNFIGVGFFHGGKMFY